MLPDMPRDELFATEERASGIKKIWNSRFAISRQDGQRYD
jgi:hypothetical protein